MRWNSDISRKLYRSNIMYNGMILDKDHTVLNVYTQGVVKVYRLVDWEPKKPKQAFYTTIKCGFCEFPIRIDKSILKERDNYVLCSDCVEQHG